MYSLYSLYILYIYIYYRYFVYIYICMMFSFTCLVRRSGSYYSANPKNPRLCPPGAVNNCCPPYANLALKESEKLPQWMSSKKSTSRKNYRLQWGSKYVFKRSDKLSQASLILTTLAPCALPSFENQKNHAFRIGGVQFMKLLLESSRKELPCPFLTQKVSQGVALGAERSDPSKTKKNKLQKIWIFWAHKNPKNFCP